MRLSNITLVGKQAIEASALIHIWFKDGQERVSKAIYIFLMRKFCLRIIK